MVETATDFADKVRKYFEFSREELIALAIVVAALSIAVGFNDGQPEFHFDFWIRNFIGCIFIVAIGVFANESAKRLYGLHLGYKVSFRPSYLLLFIAVLISLFTEGHLFLMAYGGIVLTLLETHRLGKFRYGLSYSNLGVIAFMGPLANLALAMFFKLFMFLPNTMFIEKAIMINVALALFNLLPLPPLSGVNMLFASVPFYVFALGASVGLGIMLLRTTLLTSILGAFVMSVIFFSAYKVFVEKIL